jgi:hypothetical protein
MAGLDVDAVGVDHAAHTILSLGKRARNAEPAWSGIEDLLFRDRRQQFASGRGWEPLHESTLRIKRAAGQPTKPLVASGALMRSLTSRAAGHKSVRSRDQLLFGTQIFYARFVSKRRPLNKLSLRTRFQIANRLRRYVLTGHTD